jgi:hypothetical protein
MVMMNSEVGRHYERRSLLAHVLHIICAIVPHGKCVCS